MRKHHCISAYFLSASILLGAGSPTLAADKFGQDVAPDLDKKVSIGRAQRLRSFKKVYNPTDSITKLKEAVQQKPDYYRAYYNLALAYHEVNDYANAKASFDKALDIREKQSIRDNSLLISAGWVAMKHDDYRRAEQLLKMAEKQAKLNNSAAEEQSAVIYLGELYFLTQRFDESERYFTIAQNKFKSRTAGFYLRTIKETKRRLAKAKR